ncbi:MAG: 2-oxoglutarate dehydrogenase E1 component [Phycisphaerales bacterium]
MSGGQPNPSSSLRAAHPAVNAWNAEYLDSLYQQYLAEPTSVAEDMRQFFAGFDLAMARPAGAAAVAGEPPFQRAVQNLVSAYRDMGHLSARIDPFGRERPRPEVLDPAYHGLKAGDLDKPVDASAFGFSGTAPTVRALMERLEACYCGPVGFEFMHIPNREEREWFRKRVEEAPYPAPLNQSQKLWLLENLTAPEVFDKFLGKRYPGKKRFSLEGGESLIPAMKSVTQRAGELGVQEIILGMPHRGRISVLRHFVGKDLHRIFTEFEDSWHEPGTLGGGDVKYHRGYSADQMLEDGSRAVHLSMLNNPSHLESVNGAVMGRCRAKQDLVGDTDRRRVISLLVHGDAAVQGQGVVAECLNMSLLEGYTVGGTIHMVLNNLVGFTTDPEDSRSTPYCTDIAKLVNAPVLHVNGDEPEAVVWAARLAADFRHEFRRDIFIDLVCFRRYGHNEQDEPAYTQPVLTQLVKNHPGTPETYRRRLIQQGVLSATDASAMVDRYTSEMDAAQNLARSQPVNPVPPPGRGLWEGLVGAYTFDTPRTAVDMKTLEEVCAALGRVPEGFNLHPKLRGLFQSRGGLPQSKKLSHADAEVLAFGTLLLEGTAVRLSGQDSRRGTFTQRHAVVRDEQTGEKYTPINNIRPGMQAKASLWDSPLSEYSVMAFDYGYARGSPRSLVMWEAQFGDFCNTAQVIIDQYMAASEAKWHRWAGLVLLLPHGYEGQGPEHSSARLERFLLLCAEHNMEVVYPSTGAQLFHALRRHMKRDFRKPLIIMTPKKYLRFESSTIDELATGQFQHAIDDSAFTGTQASRAKDVKRVIYCTGKFYHELSKRREETGRSDVAFVRIEQLYPFHTKMIRAINERYPQNAERVWAQEEPRNAGAFLYCEDKFRWELGVTVNYIGRPERASPANGSEHEHHDKQDEILSEAVAPITGAPIGNGHGKAAPLPAPAPAKTSAKH